MDRPAAEGTCSSPSNASARPRNLETCGAAEDRPTPFSAMGSRPSTTEFDRRDGAWAKDPFLEAAAHVVSAGMRRARRTIGCVAMAMPLVIAGCGQSADDRPATWSYISTTIVQPNCATANCHATITQRSNIDLSTMARGYDSLVGQGYAVPGDPNSPLLPVLRAP